MTFYLIKLVSIYSFVLKIITKELRFWNRKGRNSCTVNTWVGFWLAHQILEQDSGLVAWWRWVFVNFKTVSPRNLPMVFPSWKFQLLPKSMTLRWIIIENILFEVPLFSAREDFKEVLKKMGLQGKFIIIILASKDRKF